MTLYINCCPRMNSRTDRLARALLKKLGIEGEWEGIGHCAVGYIDGEAPKAAKRKDNRVFWVE